MTAKNSKSTSTHQFRPSGVSWAAQNAISELTPRTSFFFLFLYVFFFVALATYSLTVKLPVRVVGAGRLTSSKLPVPIKAPVEFVVGRVLVKENDQVKRGQLLVTSRDTLATPQKEALDGYLSTIGSLVRAKSVKNCQDCLQKIEKAQSAYLRIQAQGPIQEALAPLNDQVRRLGTSLTAHRQVEATVTDLRLDIKINEDKLRRIRAKKAESILAREVEEIQRNISGSNTRINERFQAAALTVQNDLQLLNSRLSEVNSSLALKEKTYNVVAPFDGTVGNFRLKGEGELLIPNQVLMDITPLGVDLIARLEIKNEDISSVKKGLEVILAVDALPEEKYGTLKGKVSDILRVEETESDAANTRGTRAYAVSVELNTNYLMAKDERADLMMGMAVQGRIVSEYATLFQTLMRTLFQISGRVGLQ